MPFTHGSHEKVFNKSLNDYCKVEQFIVKLISFFTVIQFELYLRLQMKVKPIACIIFVLVMANSAYAFSFFSNTSIVKPNSVCIVDSDMEQSNQEIPSIQAELGEEDDAKVCCLNLIERPVSISFTYNNGNHLFNSDYLYNILQPPCSN